MIQITDSIVIKDRDIQFDFLHSSGPGGQNVNKVSSAVRLRFNTATTSLPDDVRARLLKNAAKRINRSGELVIEASRFRTQEQNREDAVERLVGLIQEAVQKPKVRRKTKPTQQSKARRLESKHRHGEKKRMRRYTPSVDD